MKKVCLRCIQPDHSTWSSSFFLIILPLFITSFPFLTSNIIYLFGKILLTDNGGRYFTPEAFLPVGDNSMNSLSMYNTLIGVAFDDAGKEVHIF